MNVSFNVFFSFLKHGHHGTIIKGIIGNYLKKRLKNQPLIYKHAGRKSTFFLKYLLCLRVFLANKN